MKKSTSLRPLTIGLLGISAFALAGCKEEVVEATVWQSPAACAASGEATPAECEKGLAEAQAAHQETAPRYDAKAVCEEQHGVGNCVTDQSSGGGSIFMPILMGYMMGKLMSGGLGGGAGAAAKPLYPTPGGQMATADGGTRFNAGNGKTSVPAKSFAPAPTTVGKPPMSAAQVRSTGGFGQRATGGASS